MTVIEQCKEFSDKYEKGDVLAVFRITDNILRGTYTIPFQTIFTVNNRDMYVFDDKKLVPLGVFLS